VNFFSIHPFLALILNNINTIEKCVNLEQSGYKIFLNHHSTNHTCVFGGNQIHMYDLNNYTVSGSCCIALQETITKNFILYQLNF